MNKRVLVITNEARSYSGIIPANTLKGIPKDFNYVSNLVEKCREISGYDVKEMHYKELTMEAVHKYDPSYIVAGGHCSMDGWCDGKNEALRREYAAEMELLRSTQVPYLGICAGHQYILTAYGCTDIEPMGSDYEEEKEYGPVSVSILRDDPIFRGMPDPFHTIAYHSWEVKDLPDEFEIIGSTKLCRLAMVKHKSRPVYGTQFHPEILDYPQAADGAQLLKNFFTL